MLVHHVFFWLKNPGSAADLAQLLEGLKTLRGIETVRDLRIGVPAATSHRGVVDSTYSASELILFDDLAGHDAYQSDPIHERFVQTCGPLWTKVVVYDATDAF